MRTYRPGSGTSSGQAILVLLGIALFAAVMMWGGKWGAFASLSPFLLFLLLCPLMHFFMHGGHGNSPAADREQPPGSGAGSHRH